MLMSGKNGICIPACLAAQDEYKTVLKKDMPATWARDESEGGLGRSHAEWLQALVRQGRVQERRKSDELQALTPSLQLQPRNTSLALS